MKSFFIPQTSTGLHIPVFEFNNEGPKILILGGVHGDEIEGVEAAHGLIARWSKNFPFKLNITVMPAFNFDGVLRRTRTNARGVDLNRNMATRDWSPIITTSRYHPGDAPNSESETKTLVDWIALNKPSFILSLHSWKPMLNVNGDCIEQAKAISAVNGYTIENSIGYPTPGCLGTYAGLERRIPTLTYEIERGLQTQDILKVHIPAVEEGLKVCEIKR